MAFAGHEFTREISKKFDEYATCIGYEDIDEAYTLEVDGKRFNVSFSIIETTEM